jgi:hypothetical protein
VKRIVGYAVCILLLGSTAFFGTEGIDDFAEAATVGQKVCSVAVVLYGITAAVALLGLFLRKRWTLAVTLVWTAALLVSGTLAPRVWGDAELPWWITALSAVVILAIGIGVTMLVRWLLRTDQVAATSRDATSRT